MSGTPLTIQGNLKSSDIITNTLTVTQGATDEFDVNSLNQSVTLSSTHQIDIKTHCSFNIKQFEWTNSEI